MPQRGHTYVRVGSFTDCIDAAAPTNTAADGWMPAAYLPLLRLFSASDGRSSAGECGWTGWKSKGSGSCGRMDMLDEIRVLGRLRHPNITMVAITLVIELLSTSPTHDVTRQHVASRIPAPYRVRWKCSIAAALRKIIGCWMRRKG